MRTCLCLGIMLLFCTLKTKAQVQVSQEPRHKKVLENQYCRILDVWLAAGDTTQFHVHSTPSVFLYFSKTRIQTQVQGGEWVQEQTVPGKAWYRSFTSDTLIHRVANTDTLPLHVTDVELLSSYQNNYFTPLPFKVLFENEKVIAYQVTEVSHNPKMIKGRGPIIAELTQGKEVSFTDIENNKTTTLKPGQHLYIKPGSNFYFSMKPHTQLNLVLFEIK